MITFTSSTSDIFLITTFLSAKGPNRNTPTLLREKVLLKWKSKEGDHLNKAKNRYFP